MVVVTDGPLQADPITLFPPASPRELATLPERVTFDPDERTAIELFLRRRGRLGPARENELARMIVPALAARFDVRHDDPVRLLCLLYDRAISGGREEAPPSSRGALPAGTRERPWP
jgi:hypothetical protein